MDQRQEPQRGSRDGVLALLRALHARVQPHGAEVSLRMLLPAYERLLRPVAPTPDQDGRVMHELQHIRDVLQSESDVFNAAQSFDEHVEKCLRIEQETRGAGLWSMFDALRLLLALSGGDDGTTFVLEDPTRVCDDVPQQRRSTRSTETTFTQRLGERIIMSNTGIITQAHHTLLQSTALPLSAHAVIEQYDFSSLTPANTREAALWYPEGSDENKAGDSSSAAATALDGFLQQFQSSGTGNGIPRLIDIPPKLEQKSDAARPRTSTLLKKGFPGPSSEVKYPSPSGIDSEVFFFDASKIIKTLPFDVSDDEGSVTEASSKGGEDVHSTSSWLAIVQGAPLVGSWEELGVDCGGCSSLPRASTTSPLQQQIASTSWQTMEAATTVEIDETELIDYVAKALCGIDSVVFRRDVTTASLRLPRKVLLKLRTASPSSLSSLLDEFRVAGTAFLRLEYLSVFYSQDPSRGGKTAQALAQALQIFLSSYQRCISDHVQAVSKTGCFMSLITVLSRTRAIRKHIIELSRALTHSVNAGLGSEYWRLLSGGEFPQGVALLNLLHRELQEWEREDSTGAMATLWRWLLVRTAGPFVTLLSSYVASGQTALELDPFGEFRLSVYSTLQDLEDVSTLPDDWSEDFVPLFLGTSSSRIINVGRLQQMLCSILPQTEMAPLDGLCLSLKISDAQSQLDRTRALVVELTKQIEAACSNKSTFYSRTLRSPLKSPRADDVGDGEWIANKRKRLEYIREAQRANGEMLNAMAHERKVERESQATAERLAREEAESSQYMKWRRDRAVRLPSSKVELARQYETDQQRWQTAQQNPPVSDDATVAKTIPQEQASIQPQGSDVVMEDATDDHQAHKNLPSDRMNPVKAVDITGDGGLLWRPRIRARFVPGGGGEDAMATMYPDRQSAIGKAVASAVLPQKRSVVIQPGRHEGSAAYETIYGSTQHHLLIAKDSSQEEVKSTNGGLNELTGVVNMEITEEEPSPAFEDVDVVMAHDDMQVTATPAPEGGLTSSSATASSSQMQNDFASKNANPALAILQPVTNFLCNAVSTEDASVLNAILHPETGVSSTESSIPFQSLTAVALEDPITVIHDFIDRMALQAMVVKLDLKVHLLWLHRIALMSDGLCMAIFTRDLFSQLQSDMRVLLVLPGRLTTSLALAMIEARVVITPAQLPSFDYRVENGFVPAVSSGPAMPSMVEVVEHIILNYNVSQHLSAVLTPRAVFNYQRVHRFLLLLRLTEHEVKETWLDWRKSSLRHGTQDDSTRRACDLALRSAQILLNSFLETFANQVLESNWTEFFHGIDAATSVSALRVAHEEFSDKALACCFLRDNQTQTLDILHTLIESVWSVGNLICTAAKQSASIDPFQLNVRSVVAMQAASMEALATQLYRLESSTDRTLHDFAKHFLLRLNLNGFFTDTTLRAASP